MSGYKAISGIRHRETNHETAVIIGFNHEENKGMIALGLFNHVPKTSKSDEVYCNSIGMDLTELYYQLFELDIDKDDVEYCHGLNGHGLSGAKPFNVHGWLVIKNVADGAKSADLSMALLDKYIELIENKILS